MTTSHFARMRTPICALLLLALIAALLPTRQTSAQDDPLLLSDTQVEQTMFAAIWNGKLPARGAIRVESIIWGQLSLYNNASQADLLELQHRYLEQLGPRSPDAAYRDSLPYDQVARAMFDAASTMPAFKGEVAQAWRELSKRTSQGPGNAEANLVADAVSAYSLGAAVSSHAGDVQRGCLERAKRDPQFADVFDATIGQLIGVSIKGFRAKAYLDAHPNLPIPQKVRDGIRSDGTLAISIADLKELATTEFDKVNSSIGDLQVTLDRINLQQKDLVDFMRDAQARQQAEAIAKAKAQEHQLKLEAADSAIFVVATLASFIDPKVGGDIATVGRSALQIGESLNGWMQAVAGLNTLDKLTSLSTVVMTGNVLGAVLNVVGLFGSSGPSPDQIILEEIGKLRQQVDQLRTEMHDRFDHVDQELNTIYNTMQDRFNRIDVQLGKISGSLDEIQKTLLSVSLALSRLERNNFEYLDAVGRRPLLEAINGGLDYKQRTGANMPYQPDFVGYENTFQTWGTINAFDALSAGPMQRDYSDGQVLAELSSAPLDANVNYLNGWLGTHGMQPIATKRLASPRDWAFASRAYAQLGFDWPEHLRRIDPQRQAALDAVGNDLEVALGNISTNLTANGPQGNAPLFTQLLANYSAKLGTLDDGIKSSETAFTQELQGSLQRTEPFNLFGGLDQPLSYQPADVSTMTCGGKTSGLATPQNLQNIVPNYNRAALANYLRLSTFSVCLTGEWVNTVDRCHEDPLDPSVEICDTFAEAQAHIAVLLDGVAVVARTANSGASYDIRRTPLLGVIMRDWGATFKPQFDAQFATPPLSVDLSQEAEQQLIAMTDALTRNLSANQQKLYARLLNGLNSGGLHPAVVELGGAKQLLDSFVTLGFPQALNSDDFLRSLLFSDQQLADNRQVIATYVTRAAASTSLTANPRLLLLGSAQKRRDALSGVLGRYLQSISDGSYREDSALIANARLDMRLARRFADAPASGPQPTPEPQPTPGQRRAILLPLVMR